MIAWWDERSIRFRLVTLYTVALLLVLAPASAVSYGLMRAHLLSGLDEALAGESDEAILVMSEAARLDPTPGAPAAALRRLAAVEDVRYELWSESEQTFLVDGFSLELRNALPPMRSAQLVSVRLTDGTRHRILDRESGLNGQDLWLRVATSEDAARAALSRLLQIHMGGLLGALVFAGSIGYLIAHRALAPVRLVTERARLLSADRLADGIPIVNPKDELGRLALTFNDLFGRLDTSFKSVRRFAADASHELRTPLTAIRSAAELGLDRDESGRRECFESILEEVRRVAQILDSLLLLARAENDDLTLSPTVFDLADLSREVTDELSLIAESRSQTLRFDAPKGVDVFADRDFVRHALLNVVDNSIKHGGDECSILVGVRASGSSGVVTVTDDGPGIPAAEQVKVFERFYRAGRDSGRTWSGSGLGLAIASSAVAANRGTVELDNREGGGATFRILLPLAPASPGRSP